MIGRKKKPLAINRDMARQALIISKQKAYERAKKAFAKREQSLFVNGEGDITIPEHYDRLCKAVDQAVEEYERANSSLAEFDKLADSMTDEEIWERWFK